MRTRYHATIPRRPPSWWWNPGVPVTTHRGGFSPGAGAVDVLRLAADVRVHPEGERAARAGQNARPPAQRGRDGGATALGVGGGGGVGVARRRRRRRPGLGRVGAAGVVPQNGAAAAAQIAADPAPTQRLLLTAMYSISLFSFLSFLSFFSSKLLSSITRLHSISRSLVGNYSFFIGLTFTSYR